jgi:CheY-like chemotaxis protein
MLKQSNRLNVMVVDDEDLIRTSLCRFLQKNHYEATPAKNGGEALTLLSTAKPFDLIILDLLMPEKSGYEFLQEMKLNIPVIIISAFTGPSEMDLQFKNHPQVIGYIKKPFESLINLVNTIESTYENHIRKI